MNVLITGSNGFVGKNLVPYLKKFDGISVDTLDKTINPTSFNGITGRNIIYKLGSYEKEIDIGQYDVIIHLAAESHVDRSINSPRQFVDDNIHGTLELLEWCRKSKRLSKFVMFSTDEVGACLETGEFFERGSFSCGSTYSASKAAQEHLCQAYIKTFNLPIYITRCVNIFGPQQAREKFIPTVINNAMENKKIPVYGDGYQERQWVHVEHVCNFIHILITATYIPPNTVAHITGTKELPNIMMATTILGILGKSTDLLEHVEDRKGHDERYALGRGDETSMFDYPNYEKKFVEDLIATVNWYKDDIVLKKEINRDTCPRYFEEIPSANL